MGANKVILVGNLGKAPEVRYTAQNLAVCRLRLATNERRRNSDGNVTEHTEWHNVVTFGKTAENCAQYLRKGKQVYVEGRLHTNKWQDKEGASHWSTEIIANSVQFLGSRSNDEAAQDMDESEETEASETNILDIVKPADQIQNREQESLDGTM